MDVKFSVHKIDGVTTIYIKMTGTGHFAKMHQDTIAEILCSAVGFDYEIIKSGSESYAIKTDDKSATMKIVTKFEFIWLFVKERGK